MYRDMSLMPGLGSRQRAAKLVTVSSIFGSKHGLWRDRQKVFSWSHISSEHIGIRSDFILYIKRLLKISFHILDNIEYHRCVDVFIITYHIIYVMITAVTPHGDVWKTQAHQVSLHYTVHQHVLVDEATTVNL